jgi:hypothetical protein
MNLGDIRGEVKSNLGNRSSVAIPDTRYNLWINNSQIEIASAFQFFDTEKWSSRNTVIGSIAYALPTDCLAIYSLRDNTNARKIIRTGYRKLDNIDFATTGTPTRYIRYKNNIMFNYTPNAIIQLYLRYCVVLTAMVDDIDVPTIQQPWHECIQLGAEYRGWKSVGEVKKSIAAKNEYIAMVRSRNSEWEIEDSDEEFGMEVVT